MKFWFFSIGRNHSGPRRCPAPLVRPLLENLEDRCLPSMNPMPASVSVPSASNSPMAVNTIASLPHDQIHLLQDQSQQQTTTALIRLEVEQAVLDILQLFAPQVPQLRPDIALLTSVIPAQQAMVNSLQNQTNLLNQLDDLQDQSILLNAQIQNAAALVPMFLQQGNMQEVNMLQSIIAMDQAAVQALPPQITAVEVEVSAFI